MTIFGVNIMILAFTLGIILAFVLFKVYKKDRYISLLQWTILALNMICSLLWLSTAAGAIVDLIEVFIILRIV